MTPYELQQIRERTSFEPLCPGGANFRSHRLDFTEWGRVRVVSTWGVRLFSAVFMVVGVVWIGLGLTTQAPFFVALLGGVFFLAGCVLAWYHVVRKSALFNLTAEQFVRGSEVVDFTRIAALQVVVERCSDGRCSPYLSRELNLVLDDGSRVNVIDHGDLKGFEEDTRKLAEKLNLEVWDKNGLWAPGREEKTPFLNASPRFVIIFGLAFTVLPTVLLSMLFLLPLARTAMSHGWVECPATVKVAQLESRRDSEGTTYRIQLQADYTWEGRTYSCTRYDFFHGSMYTNIGVKGMRQAVADLPVGTQTYCLVNPRRPDEAVMRRGTPSLSMLLPILLLLVFVTVGVCFIRAGLQGLAQERYRRGKGIMDERKET